jgi:hypothetical protein
MSASARTRDRWDSWGSNVWALENDTPFAAERSWARDRDGAEVWLVAVKGTYTIHPDGATTLAREQEPVWLAPQYRGTPGQSSLLYESDLVHTKPTTDILLHGHAYAPGGRPTAQLDATLKIAGLSKTLRVFGDRTWAKGLRGPALTDPTPFVKMPLTYERSYGGNDPKVDDPQVPSSERRNPVGRGFALAPDHLAGRPAANVEDPGALITSWRQRPRPSGFGPIARDWSPRLEYAGTYDAAWDQQRRPLLPLDFQDRYYQCAPEDQQAPGYLRGGEAVELHHLTPEGALRFTLPRVVLGFTTRIAGRLEYHRANLHTVTIEPDAPRVILAWHTALACHHDVYTLKQTTIFVKVRI